MENFVFTPFDAEWSKIDFEHVCKRDDHLGTILRLQVQKPNVWYSLNDGQHSAACPNYLISGASDMTAKTCQIYGEIKMFVVQHQLV